MILADDREKKPLLFPDHLVCLDHAHPAWHQRGATVKLTVVRQRLDFGDYLLAESPRSTIIERKASLNEIAGNCLNKRKRELFVQELEKLRGQCDSPVLLFEGDLLHLSRPSDHCPVPDLALDALVALLCEYRVQGIFLPSLTVPHRREAAKYAARLLIQGSLRKGTHARITGRKEDLHLAGGGGCDGVAPAHGDPGADGEQRPH